jgi:Tfp pilus assembly protein PilE
MLIELMIIISIVAILVTLAVPAYQEYSTCTKITECMVGASPAQPDRTNCNFRK